MSIFIGPLVALLVLFLVTYFDTKRTSNNKDKVLLDTLSGNTSPSLLNGYEKRVYAIEYRDWQGVAQRYIISATSESEARYKFITDTGESSLRILKLYKL